MIAHPAPPYQKTARAIVETLKQRQIQARIQLADRLTNTPLCPKLWAAIGARAVTRIRRLDAHTPLVAALVTDTRVIAAASPATGVTLLPPLEFQWRWFRRLLPRVKTLGVLYNPKRRSILEKLIGLGRRDDVTIEAIAVESPEALAATLHELPDRIEALWLLGNGRLFSATTARSILMAAFRQRIPLVGLSRQWVEAGALYAFDWSYQDLGRQAADQIVRLWRAPRTLPPPAYPRELRLTINRQVFQHLGLALPHPLPKGTVLLP